jgi:RsiW-degrading membrane proteinase PrsW (M82 family)
MYSSWVLLIIIFLSSIPVITVYIWFRLAKYQFTYIEFLIALVIGAAAFFPALILQNILNISILTGSRLELFYHFFIRIAFTEELSRLLMLIIFFRINIRFNLKKNETLSISPVAATYDIISFGDIKKGAAAGLVAGLGFAVLESAIYGASNVSIILLRAITAAPLHGACGSRVGTAAMMLRTNPFQAILRVLSAVAIHGIYNLMINLPGLPSIAAFLVAISALASSIMVIHGGWSKSS